MTRDELIAEVWESLPMRKHLLGRERVGRIVERALKQWPIPVLYQCDAGQTQIVAKHFARRLERQEREYGMGFLASIILAAIISEIVKKIVQRWLENRTEMLEAMQ
jgi:UbiD family decarboxylase